MTACENWKNAIATREIAKNAAPKTTKVGERRTTFRSLHVTITPEHLYREEEA
jgi:hypothetical protein